MVKRTTPTPRNVIRKFGETVAWYPHTGEINSSGRAVHTFDGPVEILASIRAPTSNADSFGIDELGQQDSVTYIMDVLDAEATGHVATDTPADEDIPANKYGRNVDVNDRIVWEGDTWRATYRRRGRRNGISRFNLVEDDRDRHSDTSTEGPDDDTDDPGDSGETGDDWEVV